ncbi:entericidin A/B family lipoprotein [Actibacterium sp. D379-3]
MTRLLIVSALLALTACGTVEGIGEDISSGSRMVRDAF